MLHFVNGIDTALFLFINRSIENPFFDWLMPVISQRWYVGAIVIAFFLAIKDWEKAIVIVIVSLLAVGLGDPTANILKHLFHRIRPCHVIQGVHLLAGCTDSFSFPSNHATNAFAVCLALGMFNRKVLWFSIPLAAAVSISRLYVGVHYPGDVIFGGIWGFACLMVVIIAYNRIAVLYKKGSYRAIFILFLLFLSIFRLYYIGYGPIGLSGDEAHYWEWSRRLALSYYSKGPVIAYLIALETFIFGNTEFAIRIGAVIFSALSSIVIYILAMRLFEDEAAAVIAGILPQITPLFAAYGIIMTIDAPFIFLWSLTLLFFYKAISDGRLYWYLAGITIGLGLLMKYTMALFYPCAMLLLLFSRQDRLWLKRKEPYISFIVSLVIFSPVMIWNAGHDYVTFRHTAGQVHIADGLVFLPSMLVNFLGSQIIVITPLLLIFLIYGTIKIGIQGIKDNDRRYLFLFLTSIPIIVFFLLKSIQGKVEGNWTIPGYISAFIASAYFFVKQWHSTRTSTKRLIVSGLILAFLVTVIAHYPDILRLPPDKDPSVRLKGWREMGRIVTGVVDKMDKGNTFIFTDSYQLSSLLAFYVRGNPVTYCINLGRRMNQYDLWPGFYNLVGRDAIFVKIGQDTVLPPSIRNAFDRCEAKAYEITEKGRVLRDIAVFRCYGFKGMKEVKVKTY